ncbi:MAG: serine/threonine-protein kinase, partial [Verrucomicrobiales bacterium]
MNEPAISPPATGSSTGVDALAVGRSVFGYPVLPAPPQVDGYSEIAWLAEGGFGDVWRARRDSDGACVALKIPHHAGPEAIERLEQEAGTLRSLAHPHIVRLHEVIAATDGSPVLAMELVDGPPLTAHLPPQGFDLDHALQVFLPVLDAVAHAHARGILHRDLKPGNILIVPDGTPKITDFGLAQPLHEQRINFALTQSGVLAGTVEYLAPELYAPNAKPAPSADIYALGVILYEMLTGRPPRGAWQAPSQIKKLDVRLDELILEAIAADPAKRLSSAEDFKNRLEEIRDTRPRYSGTPLVTRVVRVGDAIWTLGGLYCLAAAFCALLRANNTSVPGFLDLSFGHTYMLGGFWALWVLTAAMAVLWLWQILRLWHFRKIPLREALPSPLGLRLGRSRGAAVAVGLAQFCCLWAPLLYMGWLHAQVWHWADADTAAWHRVLAIPRWGSTEPVSMWTWEPGGMFSGDEFWVREMQPGYPHKTWQLHDRQSFLVVTQPLIMLASALVIAGGIVATTAAAVAEWRNRRPGLLVLCAVWLGATATYQTMAVREGTAFISKPTKSNSPSSVASDRRRRTAIPKSLELLSTLSGQGHVALPVTAADCAPIVTVGSDATLPRDAFMESLHRRLLAAQEKDWHAAALRHRHIGTQRGESVFHLLREQYSHRDDGPSSGAFITVLVRCRDDTGDGWLTGWEESSHLLYEAVPREMTAEDTDRWLAGFLNALHSAAPPKLDEFFLPHILAPD